MALLEMKKLTPKHSISLHRSGPRPAARDLLALSRAQACSTHLLPCTIRSTCNHEKKRHRPASLA